MSPEKLNHTTWDCKYHIVFIPNTNYPAKHPVSGVVGFMKGKGAIDIARQFIGKRRHTTWKVIAQILSNRDNRVELKLHKQFSLITVQCF